MRQAGNATCWSQLQWIGKVSNSLLISHVTSAIFSKPEQEKKQGICGWPSNETKPLHLTRLREKKKNKDQQTDESGKDDKERDKTG